MFLIPISCYAVAEGSGELERSMISGKGAKTFHAKTSRPSNWGRPAHDQSRAPSLPSKCARQRCRARREWRRQLGAGRGNSQASKVTTPCSAQLCAMNTPRVRVSMALRPRSQQHSPHQVHGRPQKRDFVLHARFRRTCGDLVSGLKPQRVGIDRRRRLPSLCACAAQLGCPRTALCLDLPGAACVYRTRRPLEL